MRPDEMVIGTDPAIGKDETVVQAEGGCARCGRQWPSVKFSKVGEAIAAGNQSPEVICDSCQRITYGQVTSPVDGGPVLTAEIDIAQKIDEAQGVATEGPRRYVVVEGVESRSNVDSFSYGIGIGLRDFIVTELEVTFKGRQGTPNPCYVYHDVPIAVCEAWIAAPSKGSYFHEFIKNSYPCTKRESK